MKRQTKDCLEVMFDKEDHVCAGETVYEKLVKPVSEVTENDRFIVVNPYEPGSIRKKENLVKYRNFLIEFDGMTQRSQFNVVWANEVPFSLATFSGGQSIHFIISLHEPVDEESYRKYTRSIKRILPLADRGRLNPANFTRIAGATRDNGNEQELLRNYGRVDNETFYSWLAEYDPGEPETPPWEKKGTRDLKDLPWNTAKVLEEADASFFGSRHDALGYLIKDLLRLGFTEDEALEMSTDAAENLGLAGERDYVEECKRLISFNLEQINLEVDKS